MNRYYFHSRIDITQEPIAKCITYTRLKAAKVFAGRKQLSLKEFLKIYAVKPVI